MAGHPNSLANLKPPWQPGVQPKPGERYVERMLARANKSAPQAMRLIAQAMRDPELPMSTRLRCAEFIVDKTWPKEAQNGILGALAGGAEFLELRFVAPQQQADAVSAEPPAITTTYEVEAETTHTSPHNDAEPEDEPSS